ncbi:MAG TPA: cation:proton antiporter [Candidatus Binatia bacterium]|nr:cation:proton antiporter [Candidatus Binatia bacterium]
MDEVGALAPVILLLFVGIVAILLARPFRTSPIVGYVLAGTAVGPHGLALVPEGDTTRLLADLGVVFLLFDIGLTFSLQHVWDARTELLGLGPLQLVLCGTAFTGIAAAAGLPVRYAVVIGAMLALSSSAAVVQTLTERRQQSCPVGLAATAVLVFQDIAAIFLLILVGSIGGAAEASLGLALAAAAAKAALAFVAAVLVGRWVIGSLFDLLSRSRNEDIFTATALLVVLATAAATSTIGLSLTLGAFLGGMIIAETPYRHVIQTEVKPFRGLLLGFFFITVGMSLDPRLVLENGGWVVLFIGCFIAIKAALNAVGSLAFRWSIPGSIQLGLLLAQGDEFAFVILADRGLRAAVGERAAAVLITGIAASLALTPALATAGRRLAGRLRRRTTPGMAPKPQVTLEPVAIVGMGQVGRTVADGLQANGVGYAAVEFDPDRFVAARADGYLVVFGDPRDFRLMATLELERRSTIVVAVARYEVSAALTPIMRQRYPHVVRFIGVDTEEDRQRFEAIGMHAVVSRSTPHGLELAAAVLAHQGVEQRKIAGWLRREQQRALDLGATPTGIDTAASA